MFVNNLYAEHLALNDPRLCIAFGGETIRESSIAILMPLDSDLLRPINRWLSRRLRDGSVSQLLAAHGAGRPVSR